MPIRPDLRHLYRGAAWRETRDRILARAKNRCELCQVKNEATIERGLGGCWRPDVTGASWRKNDGRKTTWEPPMDSRRVVKIVLTIAHLNHVAGDDRDDNLKALCQWCHLHYDKLHHRETRASRKDAARPKSGRSMRALLLSRSKTRSSSYLVDSQAAVQQKSVAMMLAKWRELIDLRASIKAAETPGG